MLRHVVNEAVPAAHTLRVCGDLQRYNKTRWYVITLHDKIFPYTENVSYKVLVSISLLNPEMKMFPTPDLLDQTKIKIKVKITGEERGRAAST